MFIKASTIAGDVVLVHFGGSGSELDVCKRLGRNFISAEIDEKYYQMIIDRLDSGEINKKYRLMYKEEENQAEQLRICEKK
jgi:DNA modification methylase